jgi:hypothetical protein
MSTTIHFSLISEPHLLDIIDDEWMQDTLADDGAFEDAVVSQSDLFSSSTVLKQSIQV